MPEYRCIGCGYSMEHCKQRTCPQCGYTMYETPYDRAILLKNEIIRFITLICQQSVDVKGITWGTKWDDDMRFPDFHKIRSYVFNTSKTDIFFDRLRESISQIKEYIHTPFQKTYTAEIENLHGQSDEICSHLKEILAVFAINVEFNEPDFPELKLFHNEMPNAELIGRADIILDLLAKLADKIHRFIKFNSIYYGKAYQPIDEFHDLEKEPTAELDLQIKNLNEVLVKEYFVDILEDGTEQLKNMLQAVWDGIYTIMSIPMLRVTDIYSIGEINDLDCKSFNSQLKSIMNDRFAEVVNIVNSSTFLSDSSEERFFELYNSMLDLDKEGIMRLKKGKMLKTRNSEQKLNALIGLESVKVSIKKLKAFALVNKGNSDLNLHMAFCGNPGTGKTEVARIIAGILHENGLLPTDKVVETDRSGLVAEYIGQTAIKTMKRINEAMGGVLFIDEAYALTEGGGKGDYGHEAIATLIKAMEDYRGKFCVILAGYRNPIQKMIASNPGFRSRIQFNIDFPNYARNELGQIAELMLNKKSYAISSEALERILDITDFKRKEPNFANARELRNTLDQVMICQNLRCMDAEDKMLEIVDVNSYIKDARIKLPTSGDGIVKKILSADDELDALIGLSAVKRMVKKIKAYAKRNKNDPDFNLHMCFYGNPGTGKTEVARLLSRILYEADVLPEAKLTETDANGLIGRYIGETAPKTLAKINDAMGGVLFIDEAYSLTEASGNENKSSSYGDEAIAVLLKEMEDHRGQFCVILAGYRNNMESMLSSNPGMKPRIQFQLNFSDYSREELGEIALAMLKKKKYIIDGNVLELVLDITDYYRKRPNFANARTMRNILDQVIMNQNLRTEDLENSNEIILSDVEDYIADEGVDLSDAGNHTGRIGFV